MVLGAGAGGAGPLLFGAGVNTSLAQFDFFGSCRVLPRSGLLSSRKGPRRGRCAVVGVVGTLVASWLGTNSSWLGGGDGTALSLWLALWLAATARSSRSALLEPRSERRGGAERRGAEFLTKFSSQGGGTETLKKILGGLKGVDSFSCGGGLVVLPKFHLIEG